MGETDIFVSYARADRGVISPIVAALRVTGSRVFLDGDSIAPGELWRDSIRRAIDECAKVMVFWCEHSSHSQEVGLEYSYGIEQRKPVCPVLLDDTTLPEALAQFQWLDMRPTVGAHVTTTKQTLSAKQVLQIQQADRRGRRPAEMEWERATTIFPEKEDAADDDSNFSHRAYFSDANLFRDGWKVDPGGGASRILTSIRTLSTAELQQAAAQIIVWLDQPR